MESQPTFSVAEGLLDGVAVATLALAYASS